MSMINQKQVLSLQQKLSPQQIQMIKLLELPTMQLEQRIKQEIEENIVLEEDDHTPEDEQPQQISVEEYLREDETPSYKSRINNYSKDDKPRQAPLAGGRSLQEYLVEQLGYRNLSEQDMRLAVYLVGSIDLYGLGCHMEDYLDLRGKTMYLCQHNLKEMVPVLNSTAGYGLLFDAGCGMGYQDAPEGSFVELEAANEVDYYFMKGCTMDKVVAQYRYLTGQSPMFPRYMFGYIQSKERYRSSEELVDVAEEYRRRQVPMDVIVQDWNYWPQGWGYMKMDRRFYPDPRHLADSLHALDAKLMVSIWPNPTNCPQTKDFAERGFMLGHSVYDAFNPLARARYWDYANEEFFGNGFDAWWCDCTEPLDADWRAMPEGYGWDSHEERWKGNLALLDAVLGAERSCLFSLYHSKGLYENQRATTDRKRVVNLTRSSYAGQQRYATITWNGDTHASWKSFSQQIPQGLNFMATGCPYWTVDIGSFFTRGGREWFRAGDFDRGVDDMGYREYYVRMLQYGAFLPLFRSHGTDTPREIWRFGEPGEPFYDSILRMIHLRYGVRRVFPNKISINVADHNAAAAIPAANGTYTLVDAEGLVLAIGAESSGELILLRGMANIGFVHNTVITEKNHCLRTVTAMKLLAAVKECDIAESVIAIDVSNAASIKLELQHGYTFVLDDWRYAEGNIQTAAKAYARLLPVYPSGGTVNIFKDSTVVDFTPRSSAASVPPETDAPQQVTAPPDSTDEP